MGNLGLSGYKLGLFLVFFNLVILVLALRFAMKSFREQRDNIKAMEDKVKQC
jgi:hypothetical protein